MQSSYKLQCNTPLLDSFRQLKSMNQTYSTAIGTHGSARHFDLTFVDSQAMVAVDVCIDGRHGDDAEWRDNMQQYLWRNPMLTPNAISHAKWESLQAQPLATHVAF